MELEGTYTRPITLHDENPIPGNITALKVPELNPEVKIPAITTKAQAEGEMIFLQKDISTAMGMCAFRRSL